MEYQLYKNIISHTDICKGKPAIKRTVDAFQIAASGGFLTDQKFTSMLFEKPALIKSITPSA